MEKILVYLIKNKKKHAIVFENDEVLKALGDLFDIDEKSYINNGVIKDVDNIKERWEIKTAKVKNLTKNRSMLKMTVEIDCKLLLRKFKNE